MNRHHFFALLVMLATASGVAAREDNSDGLLPIPEKLVVLTFDDGNKSDRALVADVLKQHGFGATYYVTEGLGFLKSKEHYTTWKEIRELNEMGFEIGNHTQHHRNVARLSREALIDSLRHIEKRCAEHKIPKPVTFCYPGFQHGPSAVAVLQELNIQFARRGVGPEFADGGRGGRGPAYDPAVDHPLLIPTTGYSGPDWMMDDLQWAVAQATGGKIAVLCFHGIPAKDHPWVNCEPADFKQYMQYLKDQGCTVIAMRDLVKYVDPTNRPADPYAPIRRRMATPRKLSVTPLENPLGLDLAEYALAWQGPAQQSKQSAYQVLVASTEEKLNADAGDLWDSRRVDAPSVSVRYLGRPLPRGASAWWKVRIWSKTGAAGPWSAVARIDVPPAKPVAWKSRAAANESSLRFVAGRHGKALAFDENTPMAALPDYPIQQEAKGVTISAWIRPARTPADWQTIFRKEDGDRRRLLALGRTGDVWGLWIGLGISNRYVEFGAAYPPEKLRDGEWHHVAGSYDGEHVNLYIDGDQIGRKAIEGTLSPSAGAAAILGAYGDRMEPFHGQMDDFRVDNRALSADEVKQIAAGSADIANDAMAGYWRLDGQLKNEIQQPTSDPPPARVVFLGNTLIANLSRYGYLETALTIHWPRQEVTFRNLGWPADDVFGAARSEFGSDYNTRSWKPPSAQHGFGFRTLIEQVDDAQPNAVIVGYGTETAFYESEEQFTQFKRGYGQLLDALDATGAALVLLGPPRQESVGAPLPDPKQRNERLKATSDFLRDLAKARGCRFVNLFDHLIPADRTTPGYTENGIHLNESGYRRLSQIVMRELDLSPAPNHRIVLNDSGEIVSSAGGRIESVVKTDRGVRFDFTSDLLSVGSVQVVDAAEAQRLKINGATHAEAGAEHWKRRVTPKASPNFQQAEKLRRTIIEKNKLAGYRLRPLNKAYIFLFRRHEMGHLAYEMQDFNLLVAEKEELISRLGVPNTQRYAIERIDVWKPPRAYPDHEVPKDIPDPDIEAELAAFTIAEGFQINLFAADPMIANPINLNWDTRGRAWVSTSSTYPHIKPGREPNDRIVILEDTDRDGRADKSTVFAEGLLVPHSVMPVKGGAFVCSATELLFLADHDGDDRVDERRAVFSGFGNADVHHMIHGLRWAPWGELTFLQSIYINSFLETPWGNRRLNGSGIWRLRPESERLEIFARGMVNPWGHAFDRWGQSFATDGAGGQGPHSVFDGAAFASAVGAERILRGLIPGKPKNTAAEFMSGRHIPDDWQGSLLANDFRANRTVRYELAEQGSGYAAREAETVLHSTHRSFRPVDIKMGPDGAVYVVDWYNPIIDHGEVDFHHPQRDKSHGRIWRLTAKGRPVLKRPKIDGAEIDSLLEMLTSPEQWTRVQATRELASRDREAVIEAVARWAASLDPDDPWREHHRLEALWLHGALRAPDAELLSRVLASGDHRARAAAVRMVAQWSSELPDVLTMLARAVEDDHPRVRLEAVNALRSVGSLEAATLSLRALYFPVDENLDYALWLAARQTQDEWLPALQSGKMVFDGKLDRVAFALGASTEREAMKPLVALVREGKIRGADRSGVVRTISALGGPDELGVVLDIAADEPALLPAIASGAVANRHMPLDSAVVTKFLGDQRAEIRTAAAELIGRWNIAAAKSQLVDMAASAQGSMDDRLAAATALAGIEDFQALAELAANEALPVRTAAIAAWAGSKPEDAAAHAADLLTQLNNAQDAQPVFAAFASRNNGHDALAKALGGKRLLPQVAAAGIGTAHASGRDLSALIDALSKSGSLQPVSAALNPQERRKLLADAKEQGDTARGEKIFQRRDLDCVKCHAIGQTGGKLGPDLSTVGAYMTDESLLESLLNPSSAIKQGYETVVVTRNSGKIVTGTLQRRTDTAVLIRDQEGRVVSVPNDDVESIDASPVSLMPQGLTERLRRDELIDLLRYLTTRGKAQ